MIKQVVQTLVLMLAIRGPLVAQLPQQMQQQAMPGIQSALMTGQIHEALRQLQTLHQNLCQVAGPNSAPALEVLLVIGDLHVKLGNLTEAERIYEHTMRVLELSGAVGSPDDGFVRMRFAGLRLAQGKTEQADRAVRDALKIMERHGVPPASQNYTNALDTLCSVYEAQGRYEDYVSTAANIVKLVMQREAGGADHANALARHARGLMMQTKFVDAALELKEAMEIGERLRLGLIVANSAALMAKCCALTGDYVQGEQITRQVIDGLQQGSGTEQVVAELQGMLGFFCIAQGKIDEAEALARKALALGGSLPGAETRKAHCLSILANVAAGRGRVDETRLLVNEATAAAVKAYGEEHPEFASFLFDMAELLGALNDTGLAMPLAERALNLRLKKLNPGNAMIALSWQQIADLWLKLESYDKALVLLDNAAPVLKKTLGAEHAKTLSCDLMRAKAYVGRNAKGDAQRAQALARRLLDIMVSAPGQQVADIENLLRLSTAAALRAADIEAALASAQRLWASLSGRLPQAQLDGDSGNRLYVSALLRSGQREEARRRFIDWSLALHQMMNVSGSLIHARQWSQAQRSDNMFAPAIALQDGPLLFDTMQRFKGLLMDLMEHEHQLMTRASRQPETRTLAAEVQALTAALRRSWLQKGRNESLTTDLTVRLEKATQDLLRKLGASPFKRETWTAQELAARLPAQGALVDIVRVSIDVDMAQPETRYAAAVLRPGQPVQFVNLGDAKMIDAAAANYLRLLEDKDHLFEKDLNQRNRTLYTLALAPLLQACGTATEIILVPDGAYHHMPLAALRDEQDAFVCEHRFIRLLNQASDLMRPPAVMSGERRAVLLGAIDYDDARPARAEVANQVDMRGTVGDRKAAVGLEEVELNFLPNSEPEVRRVAQLFHEAGLRVETYTSREATEPVLRALRSPDVLHVASHSYTLDRLPGRTAGTGLADLLPAHEPDAMMLSGLALAGAKKTFVAWRKGSPPPPPSDGVLLAGEAADLDLRQTRLVTLSACTTGRGETRNGIGMYGLKQGFFHAGAQNMMVTLWPIADAPQTVEVITAFYQRLLAGASPAQALQQVQREFLPRWRAREGTVVATFLAAPFVITSRMAP